MTGKINVKKRSKKQPETEFCMNQMRSKASYHNNIKYIPFVNAQIPRYILFSKRIIYQSFHHRYECQMSKKKNIF